MLGIFVIKNPRNKKRKNIQEKKNNNNDNKNKMEGRILKCHKERKEIIEKKERKKANNSIYWLFEAKIVYDGLSII